MKKLLLLKSVLLLCALIAGSGSVWADGKVDVLNQTWTTISGTQYSSKTGLEGSASDAVYSVQCAGGNSSIQLRSSNSNSGIVSTTSGGTVKKVKVTWNSATTSGRTINIYGSNSAYSAPSDLYGSNSGTLLGTIVYGTSTELDITGDYTHIGIRSASGALYLTTVEITWDATTPDPDKEDITLSFPLASYEADLADGTTSFTAPTLSNNKDANITVAYSSSKEGVATVNESTGAITLVGRGSTTITATFAGNETYNGATASYTLTVTNSNANDGSLAKPFTVAEAIEFIEAKEYESINYYVTGKVSQIGSLNNGALTYHISDDGTTTDQLQVYRGKGLANSSFAATTDISVNDAVIVYGPLLYYSNSTPEINSGSYIYSLNGVKTVTLTIADATNGTIAVTNGEDAVESGALLAGDAELTVTATPNTGYSFGEWSTTSGIFDDETSASATLALDNADATLSATFTKNSYTLDVTSAHGTVNVTVDGETWNGTDKIPYGASVSMTAVPATDYTFSEWDATLDEYDAITNPLEFTMPADDVMVEAKYLDANIEYTITINNVTGGTITADVAKAKAGATVTLSYELANSYAFGEWSVVDASDNEVTVTNNQFTMPTSNVTVTASYTRIYEVLYSVAGVETAVERLAGAELNLPVPAAIGGMEFAGWAETDDVTSNPTFVANTTAVTDDMILYAFFTAAAGESSYQLVEADQDDWSGDYLIAYNATTFADGRVGGTATGTKGIGVQDIKVNPGDNLSGTIVNASWGDLYKVTLEAVTGGYVMKTQDGKYNYTTGTSTGISTTSDISTATKNKLTIEFVKSSDILIKCGTDNGMAFRYNLSGYFRFYAKANQKAIYLYKKTTGAATYSLGTPKSVTVGDSKYATYCSNEGLDFSASDVKAYTAKVDGNKVVLTQVANDIVPANTGVILYCETAGNYDIPVIKTSATVSDNEMVGVTESTPVAWTTDDKYNYILQNGVFNNANGGNLKANRAYLHTTYDVTATGARALVMVFDGETTGITDNKRETITNSREFYNLNGQRVAQPTKGLYIVNGHKVVIR